MSYGSLVHLNERSVMPLRFFFALFTPQFFIHTNFPGLRNTPGFQLYCVLYVLCIYFCIIQKIHRGRTGSRLERRRFPLRCDEVWRCQLWGHCRAKGEGTSAATSPDASWAAGGRAGDAAYAHVDVGSRFIAVSYIDVGSRFIAVSYIGVVASLGCIIFYTLEEALYCVLYVLIFILYNTVFCIT